MPQRKRKKSPRSKAAKKASPSKKKGELTVYDKKGKVVDTLPLDPIFQDGPVNAGVVYQAILQYRAGEREGTASTKDRAQVRGGGKKPWKQKGTGRARHGSRRSPIWRGGGITFGPKPRDYSYSLPLFLRRKAVVETLKDKVSLGRLFLLNGLDLEAPKTSLVSEVLDAFKLEKPLFLVDRKDPKLLLASRNIPGLSVKTALEVNALDVASHRECVMTREAYQGLLKRLSPTVDSAHVGRNPERPRAQRGGVEGS